MPKSSRGLGVFEVILLAGIRHLGENATGANLLVALQAKAKRTIAVGQLYLSLATLESRGLIGHRILPAVPIRGGRSKKLYLLTEAGANQLDDTLAMLVDNP